jgi:hypothetical protein
MNSPQQFKAAVVRIYFSTKKHVSERKFLLTDMPKLLVEIFHSSVVNDSEPAPAKINVSSLPPL